MPEPSPRQVIDNCIISPTLPPARIQVAPAFSYVGHTQFILYKIAHVEQHLFVVADADGAVERLLWVQFEGFLPHTEHTYKYTGEIVTLGGLDFVHHSGVRDLAAMFRERPDSDGAAVQQFLQAQGYRRANAQIVHRYVHMPDEARRHELMIIYAEPLTLPGFHPADFEPNGTGEAPWPALQAATHGRAMASFTLHPL